MNDNDKLEDISPQSSMNQENAEEKITITKISNNSTNTTTISSSAILLNVDSETEVFDRIASKLLRSGLLLTALELHAELIERDKELPRLREFFDNPHNFEKQTITGERQLQQNNELIASVPRNVPQKSPSEQTFDSFDFTHYSDDDIERHVDERIAVLEFELRKAHQTINSLRASLTMSTTYGLDRVGLQSQTDVDAVSLSMMDGILAAAPITISSSSAIVNNSLTDSNSFSDRLSLRDYYYCRGSGDGDSCPGEDDPISRVSQQIPTAVSSSEAAINIFSDHHQAASGVIMESVSKPNIVNNISSNSKYSLSTSIKPHERRAINYLINEYLMANNYKLTSITFCDENTDQDFDKWDDVGLNTDRPPDLLRLYRYFWQNCSSLLRTAITTNSTGMNAIATSTKLTSSSLLLTNNFVNQD